MARGKLLRTKMREAVIEASIVQEAIRLGDAKAEIKIHEKKPLLESFKEHLGKMIDRVDPVEIAALGVTTFLVHEVIITTAGLLDKLSTTLTKATTGDPFERFKAVGELLPLLNPIWGSVVQGIGNQIVTGQDLNVGARAVTESTPQTVNIGSIIKSEDLLIWAISFAVAFLIVRYGAEILKSFGGVSGLVGLIAGV